MDLNRYVRKNILEMKAYSSARSEFKGEASVFLDANENPLRLTGYNRYPDPLQLQLKQKISSIKQIDVNKIFLGNGSDEPIDLVIRIFCEPSQDNIIAIDPTYGMYQVCANLNNVEYRKILLDEDFKLNADRLLAAVDENTKLIFLCSPNNPSGNILDKSEIEKVIKSFSGIVILDEAYIDFSIQNSWLPDLDKHPNLIILQTFSKAWGLAAVRLGMAFASPEVIQLFNKVKYPYNINQLTQEYVMSELDNMKAKNEWVDIIIQQRERLSTELEKLNFVKKIYHSDSNFLLVKVSDPINIYERLVEKGIIVRDRHSISLCEGCLRITIGTEQENKTLIEALYSI
ncbi:MAG: histidinol-phosphate transaminase [Dysgonomonas sp.]